MPKDHYCNCLAKNVVQPSYVTNQVKRTKYSHHRVNQTHYKYLMAGVKYAYNIAYTHLKILVY